MFMSLFSSVYVCFVGVLPSIYASCNFPFFSLCYLMLVSSLNQSRSIKVQHCGRIVGGRTSVLKKICSFLWVFASPGNEVF